MSQSKNITDMTVGSPLRHILIFTLPLLVGNLFQQLYNLVDSVVVGNYVGANALAAVGTCGSLGFLFFSLSSGLAIGIGILASQYFGAKDEKQIRVTIANSIFILVVAGGLVSLMGYVGAPAFLHLLRVPEGIFPDAVSYLRITSIGTIAVALYNGVASLLRALGDSKSPLYFLIISSVMNVVLDLIFVLALNMGVFGVGLATILSQLFSFIISAVYAYTRVPYFRLTKEELKPNGRIIARCMQLGIPMALQNALIAVSTMVLQGVVNGFGETIMAAYTVVGRVEQLVHQPFISLSTAVTSFAGQNIGAGKTDRVKQSFKLATVTALAISIAMFPITFLFGRSIVAGFVKEPEVIAIGFRALCIDCFFYFALGMIYVPRGILNGCGDSGFALVNGATEVACRILFAAVLTRTALGFWGIWVTTGLTWTVTALVCVYRYFTGKWRRMAAI